MRYDADYDDYTPPARRGPVQHPTTMGMIGFILSIVSLGLLLVVVVLWMALKQENQQQEVQQRTRLILYWFGILDIVSLFMALAAILFSARGLAPSNPLYRGWSIAGLALGILEVIVTIIFGMFMGLAILCFELLRNRGGP